MTVDLFQAVVEARDAFLAGVGLESAAEQAAATHKQDTALVGLLAASATIGCDQARAALLAERRAKRG